MAVWTSTKVAAPDLDASDLDPPLSMAELLQVSDKLQTLAKRQATAGAATTSDAADAQAVAQLGLQPLFSEERFTDPTAEEVVVRLARNVELRLTQQPVLAARITPFTGVNHSSGLSELGSATEADSATGAVSWDSWVVLADLVQGRVQGKSVVELGAGCGGLSCALWRFGAGPVVATERRELLPLLRHNLEANCPVSVDRPGPDAVEFMWGTAPTTVLDRLGTGRAQPDVVVASDVVYDEESVPALLASLQQLGTGTPAVQTWVAVDSAYNRPRAWELFLKSLGPLGWRAELVQPISDPDPDLTKDTVRVFAIEGPADGE